MLPPKDASDDTAPGVVRNPAPENGPYHVQLRVKGPAGSGYEDGIYGRAWHWHTLPATSSPSDTRFNPSSMT